MKLHKEGKAVVESFNGEDKIFHLPIQKRIYETYWEFVLK
jgi:hypothetical protein